MPKQMTFASLAHTSKKKVTSVRDSLPRWKWLCRGRGC